MPQTNEMTLAELDALVAEKVMGWHHYANFMEGDYEGSYPDDYPCFALTSDGVCVWTGEGDTEFWSPTKRWSDAGRVIERMRELGWLLKFLACEDYVDYVEDEWSAYFKNPETFASVGATCATTPTLALILAALAAVTGERYSVREE